jgi:predicted nucleotidyltransferase
LSFREYLWHERRKFNKGLCEGTKFDITLVTDEVHASMAASRKLGPIRLNAKVIDATHAYDFPARYRIARTDLDEVLSFSHTYAGQALAGEWVTIRGQLEEIREGGRRIIVGSTREAPGEFIKVLTSLSSS